SPTCGRRELGRGDRPRRSSGALGHAVPSSPSDCRRTRARERPPGQEAVRLDPGRPRRLRSSIHSGVRAPAGAPARDEVPRDRGRHGTGMGGGGARPRAGGTRGHACMSKSYRHGQILKLIRSERISTQEELAQALKKLGIQTTQVTLSRDIRELRLVKTVDGYRETTADEQGPQLATLAAEFLLDVRVAQNLVVLKNAPGHSNSVAVALVNEEWPEIVGTIAGDDTLLVIAPDYKTAAAVRKKLLSLLEV